MNNKIILAVILGILLLGILVLGIFASASSEKTTNYNKQVLSGNTESAYYGSYCNQENEECFRYPGVEQDKGLGYSDKPEQKKVEPCITPRPVCILCREPLEQVKGDGYRDELVQEKINC